MKIRAWEVSDKRAAGAVIVFTSSRTRAKTLARSHWLFDFCDSWIDIECRRLPNADHLCADVERVIGDSLDDLRIARSLGWGELEGCDELCSECGLYEWEAIPESRITETDDKRICKGCMDAKEVGG